MKIKGQTDIKTSIVSLPHTINEWQHGYTMAQTQPFRFCAEIAYLHTNKQN